VWRRRPSRHLQACFTIFADHLSKRDSDQRRDVDAEIGEVLPICLRKDILVQILVSLIVN
jgi:hypothetical protein